MGFEEFVLAAVTADLSVEPAAREHADAVEFRLDLADDGRARLDAYDGDLPLLVTNRVEWEGGEAADEPARIEALERAVEHPAVEAVDVELAAVRTGDYALLDHARAHDIAVVVSVHDFEETPERGTLSALLTEAAELGDVGKLAVTAETRGDVLALLSATHEATAAGECVATMAMGEAGRHSRAVAPLYGSRIGYAPIAPGDATAPGQYDLATLRRLIDQLQEQ
ncbi:MAG: type I 3-dehydroquinate dehydratase [Halobacteriales archaeon SW_8_66_22]|nr:MAG: type I 3-dehydroquinate dehydratase [Halobacteriales archaeon SW_8_66_22]